MRGSVIAWVVASSLLVAAEARAEPAPPPPEPAPAAEAPAAPAAPATPPSPGSVPPSPEPGGDPGAPTTATKVPAEDLSDAWTYNRGGAPRPRYVRGTDDPVLFAPNPIGFYSGVSVGGNQVAPAAPPAGSTKRAVLTWTGFERTDVGSQVFFQLSAEAKHKVTTKGNVITIRLKNTKINTRNNKRPLDLSYFKTPVQRVRVRRQGKDAVATITLKRSSEPDVSLVDDGSASGYKLLVVRFAEGSRNEPNDGPPPAP